MGKGWRWEYMEWGVGGLDEREIGDELDMDKAGMKDTGRGRAKEAIL